MILNRLSEKIQNYLSQKEDIIFERKELAKQFLSLYDKATFSLIMYEVRRKGKTTFVLEDLAKEASKTHYVFYYSFMRNNSLDSFLLDFTKFVKDVVFQNIDLKSKAKLNLFLINAEIQVEKKEELLSLFDLQRLIKQYSDLPILLILDEFQEIGRQENKKESLGFLKELRTMLDTSRGFIKTIFLGSSIEDIGKMFSDYKQPFFNFGLKIKLPDLNEDFLNHVNDYFKKETGKELKNIKKVYEKIGKLPGLLLDLVKILKINGEIYDYDLMKALIFQKNFEEKFKINEFNFYDLSLLEKNVLKRILINNKQLSSEQSLNWIRNSDEELIDLSLFSLRAAIRKLKNKDVIRKEKQLWFINNQAIIDKINSL